MPITVKDRNPDIQNPDLRQFLLAKTIFCTKRSKLFSEIKIFLYKFDIDFFLARNPY